MNYRPLASMALGLVLSFLGTGESFAVLANAFHIPDNNTDLNGIQNGLHMRNPEFEIGPSTTVTIYSGVQKFNNPYGTANQTGGTLFYKGLSQGTWSSTSLNFANNNGNNQYWRASFNTASFDTNEVIQYYLLLTFDGANGVQNTYLYGNDAGSSTTAIESVAATNSFTIRNRPAFLFHANNRVINPSSDANHNNVQFWIKVGYIGKDGSLNSRWADNGRIYYTTDDSTPTGSLGIPAGTTQAAQLNFDHIENDPSIAGNAMWWTGTVTNLPTFTNIKYRIGLWHGSNNQEKFADYVAGANNTIFSFSMGNTGDPVLTINGVNGDYTTTHLFVDEVANDSIPLTVLFSPGQSNVTSAEVYSNLNRRDRATLDTNGDGIEDGIIPPDGNQLVADNDSNYYKAYTMSPTATPGQYSFTINAQKTGAYRLTTRYKINGNTNWIWYTTNGRRDHAIVVSPKKSRDIVLYELNTINIGSQGTQDYQRSTFVDLWNGPGSRAYDPVTNRFNLNHAKNLGVNWLWFQPIHPQGIAGRQIDPATSQPYSVGSPYAVRNFFEVSPLMSKANTRTAAMQEFQGFVAAADSEGLNIMLDAPFNHTSYDCELGNSGVFYFGGSGNPNNWQPSDQIRNREARFYSRADDYCDRAANTGNVAVAPDRGDFGKFEDTYDIFFGRYSALVCHNPQDNGTYLNESDFFDYSSGNGHFDTVTQNVWKYFADYILYWLDQTGCINGTPANQTSKGFDGLRADFGQGLPPQCWEYIINKTRTRKWDFVFMTESLDGGAVTYRSNRHFDILNENIVFPFQAATTATDYRNIFESRRNAYGQGLVLLNNTSHDEQSYTDPFQAFIRYAVSGSIDGAPMIFYGQELGISQNFGFDAYELNFGKTIPHFKKFNSLQPIFAPANRTYALDQLYPVYAAIGQARQFSRALRSSNRYYLDQNGGGGPQPGIFSVAKYETANTSPNQSDVVFAFVNLDRNNNQQGNFNLNINQNGSNLFGIKSGRTYNVKNIAAYTKIDSNRRNQFLIPGNVSGADLLNNGLFVLLKKVPITDTGWSTDPFEAQYLKLYDVTPPPQANAPSTHKVHVIGNVLTFSWPAVNDPEGGISGYHVFIGTTPGASNVLNAVVAGTSVTITNLFGQTLFARVIALNNAGIEGLASESSSGTILLDPSGDYDGDGMKNLSEDIAGTNPLDSNSLLRIVGLANGASILTWTSIVGKNYQVLATTHPASSFITISGTITATGLTTSYTNAPSGTAKYYRIEVIP